MTITNQLLVFLLGVKPVKLVYQTLSLTSLLFVSGASEVRKVVTEWGGKCTMEQC